MGNFSDGLKSIGKILIVMYAVTVIMLFLLALLMKKFQWEQSAVTIGISIRKNIVY